MVNPKSIHHQQQGGNDSPEEPQTDPRTQVVVPLKKGKKEKPQKEPVPVSVQETHILGLIQKFILGALIAFLLTSVPHVAYVLASYWETGAQPLTIFSVSFTVDWSVAISTLVSIGIDGMILAITYVIGIAQKRHGFWGGALPLYLILLFPIGISTLANIAYAQHFFDSTRVAHSMITKDGQQDIFTNIFNSMPIFNIIWTIAYHIVSGYKQVDTRSIEQKIEDAQNEKRLKQARKREQSGEGVISFAQTTSRVLGASFGAFTQIGTIARQATTNAPLVANTPAQETQQGNEQPQETQETRRPAVPSVIAQGDSARQFASQAWLTRNQAREQYEVISKSWMETHVNTTTMPLLLRDYPDVFRQGTANGQNIVMIRRAETEQEKERIIAIIKGLPAGIDKGKSEGEEEERKQTPSGQEGVSLAIGD